MDDSYDDILFVCDSPRLRPAAADGLHLGRPGDAGGGVGGAWRPAVVSPFGADKFGSIHDDNCKKSPSKIMINPFWSIYHWIFWIIDNAY